MQKIKAGWISILNKYIKLLLKFLLGCTMWLHEIKNLNFLFHGLTLEVKNLNIKTF